MYVKHELKKLQRVVCNGSNVLAHLLCCTRSYSNLIVPCHLCSCLWVRNAKFFCDAVTYHFDRVYTDNLFSFHVDQSFALRKIKCLTLSCIWTSEKFNFDAFSARVNRCMNISIAKNKDEIIES